jgi:probable phosphoglycerate mutase
LRARQTAGVLASASGLPVEIVAEVDELDAGAWTGVSFDELNRDPRWLQWNAERATARIPDGESMRDLQGRMIAHLDHVRASHPNSRVVIVSHAEPIRSAILHYRGIPLADFAKVTVEPASITTLLLHQRGGQITQENESLDAMVAA